MALKTVVDTLDGLDEAMKALYTEKDGKFVLDLEGVDAHPEVANLKSAYERVKADKATLKTEADKARDDLAAALKGKPDEAALVAERQRLEKERDDWKTKAENAEVQITGITRDNALTTALTAAGITDPGLQRGAVAILRDQVKMVDGKPVVETDMGPKALADHVKHWTASEGKSFVTPPVGGGAEGGDKAGRKSLAEMGDAERLALAREGKLKPAMSSE
ncbi:phage scaffolding protein [Paracoccus aminovorans]|uniref:phage scaffolding protein n=1 Tax=Paracoccus aminovorans TaxID=34004 RepID=UPI0007820C3B|nr:hypothetical protein [Paracoccus aminovorans]MDQ7776294.1 hypothetical protein [Paracoccus aminovorans]